MLDVIIQYKKAAFVRIYIIHWFTGDTSEKYLPICYNM